MAEPRDLIDNHSIRELMKEMMQNSSIGGVSRLVAGSWFRRSYWVVIFILLCIGCIKESYEFLLTYYSYPVVVNLDVSNTWSTEFPAISFCNINRARKNKFRSLCLEPRNRYLRACEPYILQPRPSYASTISPKEHDGIPISGSKKFSSCGSRKKLYNETELRQISTFSELPEEFRINVGHQFNDFVIDCSFNGDKCTESNFTIIPSLTFGNCYTFNQWNGNSNETLTTRSVGLESGLLLSLDLEPDEYFSTTDILGARISIHDTDVLPLPEEDGINISPGFETSIGMKKTVVERLPDPYKDHCNDYSIEVSKDNRSQEVCFRNCFIRQSLNMCNCSDPFFRTNLKDSVYCDLSSQKDVCCLEGVENFFRESSEKICDCPLPCSKTYYDIETSFIQWPSKPALREQVERQEVNLTVASKEPEYPTRGEEETRGSYNEKIRQYHLDGELHFQAQMIHFRNKHARVRVFFKTLEKTTYKQVPMFQDSELFSQMGGQLGLWIGMSIVAIFEGLEGIILLAQLVNKKRQHKKDLQQPPVSLQRF